MGAIRDATIEAVNTYIEQLQRDEATAEATLTLFAFDHVIETWRLDEPLSSIAPLGNEYVPRGTTALHDAIAHGIASMDQVVTDEKVLVVVATDGFENASQEYAGMDGKARLADLVKAYEARGNWTFVYLGANDAAVYDTSVELGFNAGNTAAYTTSDVSSSSTYAGLATVTTSLARSAVHATPTAFADAGLENDFRDEDDPTRNS